LDALGKVERILASVESLRSAPSVRVTRGVRSGRISFTEAGVDHKVALVNEESSKYVNFVHWMARACCKNEEKDI
jgi:hypothetical protein